jgi:hypothetical protein
MAVGKEVDVGKTAGEGPHAPRSVQATNRTTRSALTKLLLFIMAILLVG